VKVTVPKIINIIYSGHSNVREIYFELDKFTNEKYLFILRPYFVWDGDINDDLSQYFTQGPLDRIDRHCTL
jgi:hypothetical protein